MLLVTRLTFGLMIVVMYTTLYGSLTILSHNAVVTDLKLLNRLPIGSENNKPLKQAQKLSNDKRLYNKNQPSWNQKQWLMLPTAASVLYSLLLDSSACNEGFADWCCNYGYDEDNRKALELYLECQAIGQKLGFLAGIRSQIEEILEDY